MTEPLPIAVTAAARRLCLSDMGVHDLIARGELQPLPDTKPLRLDPGQVEQVRQQRQAEAMDYYTRKGVDLVGLAERTRQLLHPITTTPRRGAEAIGGLAKPTRDLFGAAALTAAALDDNGGCKWCFARDLARLWGTAAPEYRPAYAALFGQSPCERDRSLVAAAMAELRTRIHGPSRARTAAPAPSRSATPPVPVRRAVTAAAQPVQGDDGKQFTKARRAQLNAALQAAAARRDPKHAAQLRALLKAL